MLLKEFFNTQITNDYDYLSACMKNLLAEDKERFNKYFKIKV